mmetsp:Transcript_6815/g.12317  ORF Transcript_6815/g.12317 Transcript_6815/m.12317 type:complete len:2246 (-) Transcript_6815:168-6905(-)
MMPALLFFLGSLPAITTACTAAMKANRDCDLPCETQLQGFDALDGSLGCLTECLETGCTEGRLGNNECDLECNSDVCGWDKGDCGYCARGCFSDMLKNGKCDSFCAHEACSFDQEDCPTHEIKCSENCYVYQLGDGECNESCMTEKCKFDMDDCSPEYQLHQKMIEGLRKATTTRSLASSNSSASSAREKPNSSMPTGETTSSNTSNKAEAAKDTANGVITSGSTTDTLSEASPSSVSSSDSDSESSISSGSTKGSTKGSKPRGSSSNSSSESGSSRLCVPGNALTMDPNDISSDIIPRTIYVSAQVYSNKEDGTLRFPYTSLAAALASITVKYSEIQVIDSEIHLWSFDTSLYKQFKGACSTSLIQSYTDFRRITIITRLCTEEVTTQCTPNPAVIYYRNNTALFEANGLTSEPELRLVNVTLNGQHSLQAAGCYAESCMYCPNTLDCQNLYKDLVLFNVTNAKLTLEHVKITQFRQMFKSLIYLNDSDANLKDVNFSYVQPDSSAGAAIISSVETKGSAAESSNLIYQGGVVEYLNIGYELGIEKGGFLIANSMNSVLIEQVTFQNNLMLSYKYAALSEAGLLNFIKFNSLIIRNCTFDHNLAAADGIININHNMTYAASGLPLTTIQNTNAVTIEDCLFKHSGSYQETSILKIVFKSDKFNVRVHNNLFHKNSAHYRTVQVTQGTTSSATGITTTTTTSSSNGNGNGKGNSKNTTTTTTTSGGPTTPTNPNFHELTNQAVGTFLTEFAFANNSTSALETHLAITNNTFSSNGITGALMAITNMTNVTIEDCDFHDNGSNDDRNLNDVVLNHFIQLNLLKNSINLTNNTCEAIAFISDSSHVSLNNTAFIHNFCYQVSAGLLLKNTSFMESDYLYFIGNRMLGEGVIAIYANLTSDVQFTNLNASDNEGNPDEASLIQLITIPNSAYAFTATFSDCYFRNNSIPVLDSAQINLYFNRTSFIKNSRTAIKFTTPPLSGETSNLTIKDSWIEGHSYPDGGGVLIKAKSMVSGSVLFQVKNTTFKGNSASIGSAIAIYSGVRFEAGSRIESSVFSNNFCASNELGGTVSIEMKAGHLLITDSTFEKNSASSGAGVRAYFTGPKDAASLTLTNSNFLSNSGGSAIEIYSSVFCYAKLSKIKFSLNEDTVIDATGATVEAEDISVELTKNTAIKLSKSSFSVTQANFSRNSSPKNAGALLITASSFSCFACSFTENFAGSNAGAISVERDSSLMIKDTLFKANTAEAYGGAVMVTDCHNSSFVNTIFEENLSSKGTLMVLSGTFSFSKCQFKGNKCYSDTPAVFFVMSFGSFEDCEFSGQTGFRGVYVKAVAESKISVLRSSFLRGYASESGMIHLDSSSLNFTSSAIIGAKAGQVAAVEAVFNSTFMCFDSLVQGSVAQKSVIYLSDSVYQSRNCSYLDSQGAVFFATGSKKFKMNNDRVINAKSSNGAAGLTCLDCIYLEIEGTSFENLNSPTAGVSVSSLTSSEVKIHNSQFSLITGVSSGALITSNCNLTLSNSLFFNNSALTLDDNIAEGGAVFIKCPSRACKSTIMETEFLENHSDLKGGSIAWKDIAPTVLNLTFANNSALYGKDIASAPAKIAISLNKRRLESAFEITPGAKLSLPISFGVFDERGEQVLTDNETIVYLRPLNDSVEVIGLSALPVYQGEAKFEGITIFAWPNSSFKLEVSTSLIDVPCVEIDLFARPCVKGEYQTSHACTPCEPGYYSLDPSEPCKLCPSNAVCLGNDTLIPDNGYWRPNEDTDLVFACQNSDACIGFGDCPTCLTGDCNEGYEGNLCDNCAEGYTKFGNLCNSCPDKVLNYSILSVIVFGMISFNVVLVWFSIRAVYKQDSSLSIYFKILLNYIHFIGQIVKIELNWPYYTIPIRTTQEVAGDSSTQLYALDCVASSWDKESFFYNKIIFISFLPIAVLIAATVFWGSIALCKKNIKYMQLHFVSTLIVLMFMLLPTITTSSFNLFSCRELLPDEYWLNAQLDVRCWDEKHAKYVTNLGIPCIILWVFGAPLLVFFFMTRNKKQLGFLTNLFRFGFLWKGYRPETFYWEFVIIIRKVFTTCAVVFLYNVSTLVQTAGVQLIIVLSLYLQGTVKPFRNSQHNQLELYSLAAAFASNFVGLLFFSQNFDTFIEMILFIVMLAFNAHFLGRWGLCLSKLLWSSLFGSKKEMKVSIEYSAVNTPKLVEPPVHYPATFIVPKNSSVFSGANEEDGLMGSHKSSERSLRQPEHYFEAGKPKATV